MSLAFSEIISITSLVLSSVAVFFTFRKDAHRIRLEENITDENNFSCCKSIVLNINNDSSCDLFVLSVGYFYDSGDVKWIEQAGNYENGNWIKYPILVKARSTFYVLLLSERNIPKLNESFGYCVQLSTGRIYILQRSVSWRVSVRMHFSSLLSRISGGRYVMPGVKRVRFPKSN
ncbi:hypothetical protein [Pectobacterium brasiliense]|uniref:hypothetical protein n=1 Tax=Pectobacterium brasiliense TaxID=180957 RepID=UPI0013E01CF6|nr:hypothetical protein [Pectobacterium brasiliense]